MQQPGQPGNNQFPPSPPNYQPPQPMQPPQPQGRRPLPPPPTTHSRWPAWMESMIGDVQRVDRRILYAAGGLTVLMALTCVGIFGLIALSYLSQPRIPSGVRVAGIEIGGDTLDDAEETLETAYANQTLTLADADRTWSVLLRELGITLNTQATLNTAEDAAQNAVIQPVYQVDFAQTQAKLIALSADINIPALDGNPPQDGRSLDIPFVLDRLRLDLNAEIADGILDLNMIDVAGNFDSNADYTGVPVEYTVGEGEELGLIAKKFDVSVEDIVSANNLENADFIYAGQVLIIPAAGVYEPTQEDAPPAPTGSGKSIVVSTDTQRIYAYENGQLVRSHLVSTGLSATPTVKGDYKVYVKYEADDMSGPDYFLPQVPYTMYFYQGYAIHGTYWHNAFGRPMSHGCVNLPTDEAQWFFNFAEVGTPVRVIGS
jgi:lipoprotein-anchoring transpeptidase ErfK/SrfK